MTLKYVDDAIMRLEHAEKSGTEVKDAQLSVLQKLLKIDRQYAILMTLDMLFAGIDTVTYIYFFKAKFCINFFFKLPRKTSSAIATLLYNLAKHSSKQELLRNEIKKILPNLDSPLLPESFNNIPYLRACMKESMRVQPVVDANIRAAGKDIVLNGYQVPKDVGMEWI